MGTLEELKKQNQRLKNQIQAKKEMLEIGRARNKLLKENKALRFASKHGGLISFANTSARIGGKIGKGFVKWAKMIAEKEEKEEMMKKRMMQGRKHRRRR